MRTPDQAEQGKGNESQTEQALQRKEVLLKAGALQNAIFNSAYFSCIATDEQGVIQLFNVGAERMLGYAAAEVLNKITPADLHDPQEVLARAKALSLELGTPIEPGFDALVIKASRGIEDIYELTNIRKDGSRFPAVVSVTALRDSQAGIIGYLLIGTDNTARQQVEEERKEALHELNDMKQALNEHAIVAITDPKGKITFVNDKFCVISKYSREELLGQDHRIINSGHHSKEFIRDLWTTIKQGNVWHGEIKNRAKDGSIYWVDTTIVPFLNEQGKPRQYVAIRADITERKQTEEATARLAAIVDSSNDAIIGKDLNSIVTSWNAGAERIFGYSAQEMIGCPITKLIPSDRHAEELNIINRIKNGESVEHFETLRKAKDGHLIDLSVTVSPIKDKTGKIVGASKVARDITERKTAEEKIRQLNVELEDRVVERTAQLEMANKELEAFSYSVSHDLRSPLRAMDGFSQAVLEDYGPQLPPEGQHYLQTIREGAQRMGALIDDLLAFSRLSRAPLSKQQVNTDKLVRAVLEDLNSERQGRPIEIRIAELPACEGDPALLKQVWTNLLSNAVKYTRQRNPAVIEIGCKVEQENVYFVRDNGVGFDMRYVHKLFGVFQRLHRADQFEGTGVGLAIVQRIIHRHGGRVWVEAAPDRGASFYFTLEGKIKL